MKIALTYQPQEAQQAARVIALVKNLCPGVKARKSDRHAPFIHVYLTIKSAENPSNSAALH